MHGNESGAVTTINFPHERILSVAADQLLLADYLFGAGDWRVRVHLIWRGKPIWISESQLRPLRFASLRPQTGSAGCSHSHQRGLHGQQDVISGVIDETDRSGYTGCTNLIGASWYDCMGEASWGGIAGWGRPLTPPLSPMRWGCLSCLTPTPDGQYYPFPGYRHLAPVGGCPMEGAFIFTTPSAKIPSSTSTMTRLLWATELANRAACCTS